MTIAAGPGASQVTCFQLHWYSSCNLEWLLLHYGIDTLIGMKVFLYLSLLSNIVYVLHVVYSLYRRLLPAICNAVFGHVFVTYLLLWSHSSHRRRRRTGVDFLLQQLLLRSCSLSQEAEPQQARSWSKSAISTQDYFVTFWGGQSVIYQVLLCDVKLLLTGHNVVICCRRLMCETLKRHIFDGKGHLQNKK